MDLRRDMRSACAFRRDVRDCDDVVEDGGENDDEEEDDDDDDDDRPDAVWTAMETIERRRGRRSRARIVRVFHSL